MMGREDARNMHSFITEYTWIISALGWLYKNKCIIKSCNLKNEYNLARFGYKLPDDVTRLSKDVTV
jgi:hypothetical protein